MKNMQNAKLVFKKIKEYSFKLSIDKLNFLKTTIEYLGHIIDEKCQKPDLPRSTAIKNTQMDCQG